MDWADLTPGDKRGPPCFARIGGPCKASGGMRPSPMYKFVPADKREKFGLPQGACVCKTLDCHRRFDMAEPAKWPGSPKARHVTGLAG